jgi:hypothetical protein
MSDLAAFLTAQFAEDTATITSSIANGEPNVSKQDLAEVEAKRGIVARYEFACRDAAAPDISEAERETRVRVAGALQACVFLLAELYPHRPGYREEWDS